MTTRKSNRRYFDIWLLAESGRAWFRLGGPAFYTRQAARQWAKRNKPGRRVMVLQSEDPKRRPRLD